MSTFRRVNGARGDAAAGPLRCVARERILRRLQEAAELAGRRELGDARRLRALLEDALDQSEALQMVLSRASTEIGDAPAAVAESWLGIAALGTLADTEPVREFRLIPFGEVRVERPLAGASFEFTRRHAEQATQWFGRLGRKLVIDYEHQSFDRFNTREDGLRPAAGWIGGLEVREDGLWAVSVNWTERARALLRAGEYRYFSPVIYWSDEEQHDLAGLGPVALTNDPAMQGVESLTAAARREAATGDRTTAAGGDAAPDQQTCVAVNEPGAEGAEEEDTVILGTEHQLAERLGAAQQEITALRRQLAGRDAEAFVERGLRLGKIVVANSADWRDDYLRDPAATEARLSRSPVLLPPGRVTGVEPQAAGAVRSAGGIEPADLAAFERALAAGRVRAGR